MIILKPRKVGVGRNSQKVIDDGIKFDSKLEHYFYSGLKKYNIDFELKPKYILSSGFKFGSETIRPITLSPDYLLTSHNIIVETKGFETETFKIKWKLFKRHLVNENKNYKLVLLKSKKEIDYFFIELINKKVVS